MNENLTHYLEAWNLSDAQPLATTVTSHLYTVTAEGERVVLKLLTERGEEEKVGAIALDYWQGQGAVRLLRYDNHAHLMEYADGDNLVGLVKRGEDEQATAIIADVLNELHAASTEAPPGLYPLKRWFRGLFNRAEADRQKGDETIFMRGAALAETLLADPRDVPWFSTVNVTTAASAAPAVTDTTSAW